MPQLKEGPATMSVPYEGAVRNLVDDGGKGASNRSGGGRAVPRENKAAPNYKMG